MQPDQICNTTTTQQVVLGITQTYSQTDCTPLQVAPKAIDYYWGFIMTFGIFAAAFLGAKRFAEKKSN